MVESTATLERKRIDSRIDVVGFDDREGVWPALVSVYSEQGYDAGYRRGTNDVLAAILEVTEEFASATASPRDTRRLLHAFSELLESRLGRPRADHSFGDGSGI